MESHDTRAFVCIAKGNITCMEYRKALKSISSYYSLFFVRFLDVSNLEDFCHTAFVAQSLTLRRETNQPPLPDTYYLIPLLDAFISGVR